MSIMIHESCCSQIFFPLLSMHSISCLLLVYNENLVIHAKNPHFSLIGKGMSKKDMKWGQNRGTEVYPVYFGVLFWSVLF